MTAQARSALVAQGLAILLLVGLAIFFWVPPQGDISMWTPAPATFEVAAAWLLALGSFAWWRLGSVRLLLIGDTLAVLLGAFAAVFIVFIPIVVAVVVLVTFAYRRARSHEPRMTAARRRLHAAERVGVAVLGATVVLLWVNALLAAIGEVGPFIDYGLPAIMVGGTLGAAILLWLDGMPGVLAGAGVQSVLIGARTVVANGRDTELGLLFVAVAVASGLAALILAARDILGRDSRAQVVSLSMAATVWLLLVLEPLALVAPVAVAGLFRPERRSKAAGDAPSPAPPPSPMPPLAPTRSA